MKILDGKEGAFSFYFVIYLFSFVWIFQSLEPFFYLIMEDTVQVIQSWYVLGRLGSFNSTNLQVRPQILYHVLLLKNFNVLEAWSTIL